MTARRPTLCIVAGPNGSGKTTTTTQLLENEWTADSLYINPDNIAQEVFGDWNSPEAVLKAAEEATYQRYDCLEQGRDFVFETVFSSTEKLEFLRKAKDAGFFIRLFYVCTSDPAINVARIAQRYMNGGHEVPASPALPHHRRQALQALHRRHPPLGTDHHRLSLHLPLRKYPPRHHNDAPAFWFYPHRS